MSEQRLLALITEVYLKRPFYGYRKIVAELKRNGHSVNHKRVQRLMRENGMRAIHPKPNLSKASKEHMKYPYLLRKLEITHTNQVWATDITYIKIGSGKLYLVMLIDLYSRKILSWRLSNTLDRRFCVEALQEALIQYGKPLLFNTDQGSQFTSNDFISVLKRHNIGISMNGKGRATDNAIMERVFRSVKFEDIHINEYDTVRECRKGIEDYVRFYNQQRLHQSLKYSTPDEVYFEPLTKASNE